MSVRCAVKGSVSVEIYHSRRNTNPKDMRKRHKGDICLSLRGTPRLASLKYDYGTVIAVS